MSSHGFEKRCIGNVVCCHSGVTLVRNADFVRLMHFCFISPTPPFVCVCVISCSTVGCAFLCFLPQGPVLLTKDAWKGTDPTTDRTRQQ